MIHPLLLSTSLSRLRDEDRVRAILLAALRAADPAEAVRSAVQLVEQKVTIAGETYDLQNYRRVLVIGVGKASTRMASGLVSVLGEHIDAGVLITKHIPGNDINLPEKIHVTLGEHPVPGIGSVDGARKVFGLLETVEENDLIFCLISGGGSALMTLPQDGVTLPDLQELTRLLLASGAEIGEMNTLRKHLDRVKGGGLAHHAAPGQLVTLILSDIAGSPLDRIASGPTVADPSTYADCLAILTKYHLTDRVPGSIRYVLEEGQVGVRPETIKPGDEAVSKVHNVLVASNEHAARAALDEAERQGFHSALLTTFLHGEARQAGTVLGSILRQAAVSGDPLPRPACLIAGGETTVTLMGDGRGGRNQEVALGAVEDLAGLRDVILITLATDGEDGPTDAAGAVVTGDTLERARALGLDPARALQNNNSYNFFQNLGDLLLPGPTGTNVNDLVFLICL